METALWIIFTLWSIINLTVIVIVMSEGGNGLELNRNMTVSEILVAGIILPMAVIVVNLLNTKPWACLCKSLRSVMDYQPFKKSK